MVSLKDIAEKVGLSITTVSVVLNDKADERGIALATRKRIIEAAQEMGFQPNMHARALRMGRSNLVGIVGVNLDFPIPLMGVRSAIRALHDHGYNIALHDFAWGSKDQNRQIREISGKHADGLIAITPGDGGIDILRLLAANTPIVTIDDWGIPGVDVVTVDREVGAYQATRHLISLGHRRIALAVAGDTSSKPLVARVRGYRRAHAEAGVPVDESLFISPAEDFSVFKDGLEIIPRVLAHPSKPTALFCSNDLVAIGAMRALYEAGKRVPDDLALVGFDGIVEAEYTVVPLTTVAQPMAEVVEAAVVLLMERLDNKDKDLPSRYVSIPSRLVVRRSCGAGNTAAFLS